MEPEGGIATTWSLQNTQGELENGEEDIIMGRGGSGEGRERKGAQPLARVPTTRHIDKVLIHFSSQQKAEHIQSVSAEVALLVDLHAAEEK